MVDDSVVFAVDRKPKTGRRLRRLENIAADPRVSILFEHRSGDWRELWWVRADGIAVEHDEPPSQAAVLHERHPAYGTEPPPGPWVLVTVERWRGWSAGEV